MMDDQAAEPVVDDPAAIRTRGPWLLALRMLALILLVPLCRRHGIYWNAALLALPILLGSRAYVAILTLWLGLLCLLDPSGAWITTRFLGVFVITAAMTFRGALLERKSARRLADKTSRLAAYLPGVTIIAAATVLLSLLFRNMQFRPLAYLLLTLLCFAGALFQRAKPPITRYLVNCLVFAVSTALALAFVEITVRILYAPELRDHGAYGFIMRHPVAGFTLRPDSSGYFSLPTSPKFNGPRVRTNIRVSSQGLRDRTVGPPLPGELRIVVLGDSFALGWGLKEHQTISRDLQRMLRRRIPGRPITVLNGGVENYGPWQERIFLQERCLPLKPTLVLHELFPANDLQDSLNKVGKTLQAYNRLAVESFIREKYSDTFPARAEKWARSHWMTYRLAMRSHDFHSPLATILWRCRLTGPKARLDLPDSAPRPFSAEVCLRDWYPALYTGWALFRSDVLATRNLCLKRNVAYVAFVIPELSDIVDSSWTWATKKLGPQAYQRLKDVHITEDFCKQDHIPYVPVSAALQQSPTPAKLYYLYDGHLTPKGAHLVATALANYVVKHYADFAGAARVSKSVEPLRVNKTSARPASTAREITPANAHRAYAPK